jgi:ATP-binding protein involved in chromosome partitioning
VEQPTREQITEALGKIIDPELKRPVTELDMVREVRVEGGHVAVTIALTVAGCPLRSSFESQVSEHLLPLPGVESVSLEFDVMSPEERAALTQKLRGSVEGRSKGISVGASTRVLAIASGAPASSTPTSTVTRSRTCSGSRSARWSSTR